MKKVTVYSTPSCHFCHAAKDFLKENNIEFTDYNVAEDATKREEMIQRSGQMGVPVIFVDEDMIIGYDVSTLKKLLNIA